MELVFCTLFDSNYLDKGLALYRSMRKQIDSFKLYIFAFDDTCFKVLSDMRLKNVVLLTEHDIMDAVLQRLKGERTRAEFCWTCTPVIIEYVLLKYKEEMCTYIDADLYFFANPKAVIQEVIDHRCSVGLVAHNFERNWEYGRQIFELGRYCIQFNTFVNNKEGMQVLKDWKRDCLAWCCHRIEDGKFGDQKYPDKWKQKYSGIHESRNFGAGAAPWNLHLYSYEGKKDGSIKIGYKGKLYPLVFYHFEGISYFSDHTAYLNLWNSCGAGMGRKIRILYGEYFTTIAGIRNYLALSHNITFDHMTVDKKSFFGKNYTLLEFCRINGLFCGFQKWSGHWSNSVYRRKRLEQRKQRCTKCFYKKK